MGCCSAPSLVTEHSLEDDPVLKDLRENFSEKDVRESKGESDLTKGLLVGVVVLVVVGLVLWYFV